ncbi:MAG: DNA polymerase III subunit beta [Anaerolineales bacterium]|nr:DNA polymerase III subunit beta [Anaerolineales bacterium]MCB9129006.1 DNA polymerase III subunit beta [Ardenticatenales bacterium]
MRITCKQEHLARGMGIVGRAVSSRSTLPVLSNIFLGTEEGALKLAATNLEIGVTAFVKATVQEGGATTVPAKLFGDLVSQSPPENIQLTLDEQNQTVHYRCASVDASIKGIDAAEFPIIPTADEGHVVNVPAPLFKQMIEQVAFAAAVDESRPILTGVLLKWVENKLTLAAADGFRLSLRTAHLDHAVETPIEVIVPARALSELARIAGDAEGDIQLTVTPNRNQLLFRINTTEASPILYVELVTQLIEGKFPDIQRLIPTEYGTRTVMDSAQLLRAVRRAHIFARDAANIIRIVVADSEPGTPGLVTLSAEASELGENEEELIASVEGSGMEVAFNAKYLIDVLNILSSAQVALETTSASTPGVVKAVGSEGFTHVIMPMHLGGSR